MKTNSTYQFFDLTKYIFSALLFLFCDSLKGQTIFTSSVTYAVPVGVTSIKVESWGAGGGSATTKSLGLYGGGGGGGAYATKTFSVVPLY